MTQRDFGRANRIARRLAIVAAAAALGLAAVPAAASAVTAWVSPAPVKGPFSSCATPGYNSIQEAITTSPPKATIHVCAGEYKEQVVIEKSDTVAADPGAKLQVPASPANSTTTCDVQVPAEDEQQDLVTICGGAKVKITNLTLEGRWPAGPECPKDFNDIMVGGSSTLTLTGSRISHAGAEPLNGCQQGIGIQIGRNRIGQVGSAKLSNDVIEGYQKNGITVDAPGSKASIKGLTIKTVPTSAISQNGVQVSRGAVAKISGSTIEGNECNAPSCGPNTSGFKGPEEWEEAEDSTGVLFYLAGGGSSVKSSTISGNDIGVYNMTNAAGAKTTVSGDTFTANRYWGVALDEGSALVSNNTISGPGLVGIQIVQYAKFEQFHSPSRGQAFGATGTGKADAISGMTQCAVEGFSDNEPGDIAGSLTLTKSLSKFSGNKTELCNNNTNGKLAISVS
jgi:hypothetical protein